MFISLLELNKLAFWNFEISRKKRYRKIFFLLSESFYYKLPSQLHRLNLYDQQNRFIPGTNQYSSK